MLVPASVVEKIVQTLKLQIIIRVRGCYLLRGVHKLRIVLSRIFLIRSMDFCGFWVVLGRRVVASVDIFDNDENFHHAQTEKRDCHKT